MSIFIAAAAAVGFVGAAIYFALVDGRYDLVAVMLVCAAGASVIAEGGA